MEVPILNSKCSIVIFYLFTLTTIFKDCLIGYSQGLSIDITLICPIVRCRGLCHSNNFEIIHVEIISNIVIVNTLTELLILICESLTQRCFNKFNFVRVSDIIRYIIFDTNSTHIEVLIS